MVLRKQSFHFCFALLSILKDEYDKTFFGLLLQLATKHISLQGTTHQGNLSILSEIKKSISSSYAKSFGFTQGMVQSVREWTNYSAWCVNSRVQGLSLVYTWTLYPEQNVLDNDYLLHVRTTVANPTRFTLTFGVSPISMMAVVAIPLKIKPGFHYTQFSPSKTGVVVTLGILQSILRPTFPCSFFCSKNFLYDLLAF